MGLCVVLVIDLETTATDAAAFGAQVLTRSAVKSGSPITPISVVQHPSAILWSG